MRSLLVFGILIISVCAIGQNQKPTPEEVTQLQQGLFSNAIFQKPSLAKGLVFDYANLLSADEVRALNRTLIDYNDSTSTQIAVVTVKSLNGFPLENSAAKIGEEWGIGQADEDNGGLILVSKDDRKITIQGGYGFQAKVPASMSKIIIDQHITPKFKSNNFYGGLNEGVQAIFAILAGEYQNNGTQSSTEFPFEIIFFVLALLFFVFFISKGKGGKNNGNGKQYRRSSWDDVIISSSGSSGWGGFGGGGSSGGGFGGFGGGSFGGGGASGSW